MANRRADRERRAGELLARYIASHDWWMRSAADIAQQLNGWGFRTRHHNTLVSAQHVARWARSRMIPAKAGSGRGRGVSASALTLIAWLHGPQRCVSWPRQDGSKVKAQG